jgi:hypothetical protein
MKSPAGFVRFVALVWLAVALPVAPAGATDGRVTVSAGIAPRLSLTAELVELVELVDPAEPSAFGIVLRVESNGRWTGFVAIELPENARTARATIPALRMSDPASSAGSELAEAIPIGVEPAVWARNEARGRATHLRHVWIEDDRAAAGAIALRFTVTQETAGLSTEVRIAVGG